MYTCADALYTSVSFFFRLCVQVQIPKAELCSVCDVVVSVVKQYVDSGSTEVIISLVEE